MRESQRERECERVRESERERECERVRESESQRVCEREERKKIEKSEQAEMPFHDISHEEMHARGRAGRQVPIHREDRHFSGCQLVRRVEVFVKTAGTHGGAEWQLRSRDSRSMSSLRAPRTSFSRTTSVSTFEAGTSDLHLSSSFSSLLSRAARSRGTRLQEVTRRSGCVLSCCCEKPHARAHEQRRGVGLQDGPGAEIRAGSHERKGGVGSFDGPDRRRKQSWSRLGVRGGFFL